jgi:mutual gliding-motility protein MglA
VLQGVDGVIFVADSDPDKLSENIESYDNLIENLAEYGKDARELPHVIQYNKRDLPNAMTVEDLDKAMNKFGVPTFEAVAHTGEGVFPTLKTLAGMVLESIDRMDHRRKPAGAPKDPARTPEPQRAPAVRRPNQQPAAPQRQGKSAPAGGGQRRQAARPKGQRKGQPRRAGGGRSAPAGKRPAPARKRPVEPEQDQGQGGTRRKGGMNLLILLVVLLAAGIAGVVYFIMNNPEML